MKRITRLLILLIIISISQLTFAQHNTFYIGHSGFGWDLIVGEMVNDLAEDAGILTYDYNYQFNGGTCLSTQWEESDSPESGLDAKVELPNGYDILVMAEQIPIEEVIYSSPWGCNMTSVQAVDSFYDITTAANSSARIYLMEFHNEVDLTGTTPFDTWSTMNTDMRPLWEQVADSVSLINPGGPEVCLVPIAAAFEAMADSVIAGSFPGITDWTELFDPSDIPEATIHPTEETYYLVACVHFACIFGQSPVGLTNETFAAPGWPYDPPTTEQALMMQEIAWEIVSNDSYACIETSTSSIDKTVKEDFEMIVFPNPSDGNVNIQIKQSNQTTELGSKEVKVLDMAGREIETHPAIGNIILSLDPGIYVIATYEGKTIIQTEKLVVR